MPKTISAILLALIFSACTNEVPNYHAPEKNRPIYSIIKDQTIRGADLMRSIDVHLNEKVSENELREIALKLKAQDSRKFDRIYIVYYLPGMKVGTGGWATTNFTPGLKVSISGLSKGDGESQKAHSRKDTRNIIGKWVDESMGTTITIFRKDTKAFLERKFNDGSKHSIQVLERESPSGKRFVKAKPSRSGDYWEIRHGGNLQIGDKDGVMATAIKL